MNSDRQATGPRAINLCIAFVLPLVFMLTLIFASSNEQAHWFVLSPLLSWVVSCSSCSSPCLKIFEAQHAQDPVSETPSISDSGHCWTASVGLVLGLVVVYEDLNKGNVGQIMINS